MFTINCLKYSSYHNTCGTHTLFKNKMRYHLQEDMGIDSNDFINKDDVFRFSHFLDIHTKTFCRNFFKVEIPLRSDYNSFENFQTCLQTLTRSQYYHTILIRRLEDIPIEDRILLGLDDLDISFSNKYFFEIQEHEAIVLPVCDLGVRPTYITDPIVVPDSVLSKIVLPLIAENDKAHLDNEVFVTYEQACKSSSISVEQSLITGFNNKSTIFGPIVPLGKFTKSELEAINKSVTDLSVDYFKHIKLKYDVD